MCLCKQRVTSHRMVTTHDEPLPLSSSSGCTESPLSESPSTSTYPAGALSGRNVCIVMASAFGDAQVRNDEDGRGRR
jgi:hypothetical protein